MGIEDQPGDFIVLVGDHGFVQELLQRNVGKRNPCRDHRFGAVGCDPGETIARARRRGLGQEIAQVIEDIGGGIDGVAIGHGGSAPSAQVARRPVQTIRGEDSVPSWVAMKV